MRFNHRTCLDFFEKGVPPNFYVVNDWPEEKKNIFRRKVAELFQEYKSEFSSQVQYITIPFYNAIQTTKPKLRELLDSELLGKKAGTFLFNLSDGVVKTIFYSIEHRSENDWTSMFMEFTRAKNNDITACGAMIKYSNNMAIDDVYVGDGYAPHGIKEIDILAEFIVILTFLKYCETQTKIIEPKEKYRDVRKQKYFNETKQNIEILDSKWFTDIIRSEGFSVGQETGGFWRLQPHGENNSLRKLTWIWPFEKKGYVSKAKKHD